MTATSFVPQVPERIVRGRNFALIDVTSGESPLILGMVRSFELTFGSDPSRFIDLTGRYISVDQPAIGQAKFSQVLGPAGLPALICSCGVMDLRLVPGSRTCDKTTQSYTLIGSKKHQIAMGNSAEDYPIQFDIAFVFNDLVINGAS